MYATKRRRKNPKSIKPLGTGSRHDQNVKSNPSKRHRERLNSELEHLASLLPFEQNVIVKLDKLSILRLAVSYLRMKCYFQSFSYDRMVAEHRLVSHLYHCPVDLTRIEGEACLQALNGFIFIMSCDGEVFSVSKTVEYYLGFHQADILHQSVLELIHSEDREEFRRQLSWRANLPPELQSCTLNEIISRDLAHHLQRRFTVRFRCLLDNTSGFITLELSGRLQFLHGQSRGKQSGSSLSGAHMIHTTSGVRSISKPSSSALAAAACQYSLPPLGLFVVCSPLGPLPSLNGSQRDMTFKTKHQLDLTVTTIDSRTRTLFSYTDADLQRFKVYDLVHPEDLRYVAQGHREVFRTGSVGLLVHRWISKSCEWIWLQSRVKLMMKNGKQDHIIVIHRQLSQQEGMELLIRRSDEYKLPFPLLEPETLLSEENLSSVGTGITDYNGPFAVSHLKDFDAGFLGSIINGGDRSGGCMRSLQKTNIASLSDNEVSHGAGPKRAFQQSSSFSRFTELLAITKDYPTSSRPSIRSPLPFGSQVIRHSNHTSKQIRQQMKDGIHNGRRKKNSAKEVAVPEAMHHSYGYSGIPVSLAISPALRLPTDEYSGNLYREAYLKPDVCPFDSPLRNSGVMGQFSIPNPGMSTTLSDFNYSGYQLGLRTSGQYSTSPSNPLTQYVHHQQSFGLPDTFTRTVPLASPSGQEVRRDFGVQNFADSHTHYSGSYDAYSAAMAAAAMVAAASNYHPQHHNPNMNFAQLPSQLSIQPEPSFYADYIVPRLYQGSSQEVSCSELLATQEEIGLQRHLNRERCSPPTLLMMNLRNANNVSEGETLIDSYQEIEHNVDSLKQFSTVDTTEAFQRHGVIDGVRKVGYSGKVGEIRREYEVGLLESDRLSRVESSELDLRTSKDQLEAGSVFQFSKQPTEIYAASTDFRRDTSLAGTVNLAPEAYKSFQAQSTAPGESRTHKEQRMERSDKFTRKLEEYQTGTWRQQPQVSTAVGPLEVDDASISVGDFEEQSSLKEGFQTGDNKSTSSLCSSSSSQMHSPVNQSQGDVTHTKTQGTMIRTLSTITAQSPRDNQFWECKKQQSKSCIREQLTFNGTQFLPQSGTSTQHFSEADSLVTRQQYSVGNEFRNEVEQFQSQPSTDETSRNPSPLLLNRTTSNVGYYRESLLGSI
ncbi:hypothetical protein CRM22_006519 [Opisthorchis felineus]|uniref:Aryl hydrocarbon receptor n=1 Tax=Opisthorchis felineus TaxID=147828 RepID=A0A4S2LKG2_OPIFE|nr:hypothetical protein CRM22_006519 [Opisthorchis felineus]